MYTVLRLRPSPTATLSTGEMLTRLQDRFPALVHSRRPNTGLRLVLPVHDSGRGPVHWPEHRAQLFRWLSTHAAALAECRRMGYEGLLDTAVYAGAAGSGDHDFTVLPMDTDHLQRLAALGLEWCVTVYWPEADEPPVPVARGMALRA